MAKSRCLAFAAAMLPLALLGPWDNIPGSAYDFRLDHLAMCSLGIAAASALLTDGLRSRGGAVVLGIAVGLTLLIRFLTGTYFVLIFFGLGVWVLCGPERRTRFLNLLLAFAVTFAIAGPIFWINYETVREYYWIGHYVGPESAIRNQSFGLVASLKFVATQLGQRHLGIFVGALAVSGAIAFAFIRCRNRNPVSHDAWIVGSIFLLCPGLILTLHPQKSEVVISGLVPGTVTVAIAAWITLSRRASDLALAYFALAVTFGALLFFARAQLSTAFAPETLAEFRKVNSYADQIHRRAQAAGRAALNISIDHVTDSLEGNTLRVIVYERHRVWIPFDRRLPSGIFEPTEDLVMERLKESDFVFLTEDASAGHYPFDRKLAELRPKLREWCQANLRAVDRLSLFGRPMVLYQRRDLSFP